MGVIYLRQAAFFLANVTKEINLEYFSCISARKIHV